MKKLAKKEIEKRQEKMIKLIKKVHKHKHRFVIIANSNKKNIELTNDIYCDSDMQVVILSAMIERGNMDTNVLKRVILENICKTEDALQSSSEDNGEAKPKV